MKQVVYNEILSLMHGYGSRDCLPAISQQYPDVSLNTLGCIYSQDYQKKMRKMHHVHYSSDNMERYYQHYLTDLEKHEKHILLKLAEKFDLSPALLARIILERHLSHVQCNGENAARSLVTQMMRDTALIPDMTLAMEVQSCVLKDDDYGPIVDNIKRSVGHEYEFKLKLKLQQAGLSFIEEEQMRANGYDKTPDAKLEVPIAVDGQVINWIESKASFGDEYNHKTYEKDQFWAYWNRFGPGLVIYWFGFIDEMDRNRDKGIMLMDHFPEDIVRMM